MDEILHRARPEVGASVAGKLRTEKRANGLRARACQVWSAVQAGTQALKRNAAIVWHKADCALAGHKLMAPMPFLALAGVAAAALVIGTVYTPSYVVTVDGVDLGTVTDPTVFERVVERVESRASDILGYDYTLSQDVEYSFALTQRDKISSVGAFETYLFNQIGEVMKSYVLTVDGAFIGAAADKADLEGLLDELAAPYVTENTVSVDYVEDVNISYQYISSDVLQDLVSMEEILTANTNGETTYEVVKGDTYLAIAYANDMSLSDLMALNPQADINRLMIGDVVNVKEVIPTVSVETVEEVTYHEAIACPVETQEDSSMYKGDSKILVQGEEGEALVEATVTYVNGVEKERDIQSSTTLREPTTTIKAVGTKEKPKTASKGYFIWPITGKINSYFGGRYIFGSYSYHSGIDIAVPYGTSVKAADGGTVTFAGYKGSYGYLVIIDHGNGEQTYYGHNSSLLVSAGDKVYQGQTIAKAGSTGRSTGSHCHFEIRVNGTQVNPSAYLN